LDFVSGGPDYGDGPRHNRHYFCEELSRRAKVLFVSPPFNVERVIKGLGRGQLSASGTRQLSPTLTNYVPSKLLFTNHRFPSYDRWAADQRIRAVRRIMRQQQMEAPALIVWHPQYRSMVGKFGERLLIYYVYDQYSGYTGGTARKESPDEVDLLDRADLVFVLSRELYNEKVKYAPGKVIHLANAANFEMFSRSRDAATLVPDDIASIPGPRLGYIGTVNEKVDLRVLERLSTARPDCSIVVIGRQNYKVDAEKRRFFELAARPNVHWLGHRPYDQVPNYIKGLDVCMMCYVINDWTFFGDPSKLHEYLASGKPTIGTGLSSIREFSEVVAIPETPDDWVDAVNTALAEQGDELMTRRIAVARENSYPARVDTFLAAVNATMKQKGLH
jgi:glycosyltransferase involved in cell wall biosynthesis